MSIDKARGKVKMGKHSGASHNGGPLPPFPSMGPVQKAVERLRNSLGVMDAERATTTGVDGLHRGRYHCQPKQPMTCGQFIKKKQVNRNDYTDL